MKTIEEAAIKANPYKVSESIGNCLSFNNGFKAGVEFCQEWLPIEKDKWGFTIDEQREEMVNNLPFLLKGETEREELYHEIDNDVDKQYYTHWRPLNRK